MKRPTDESRTRVYENEIHSFVLKIWWEETAAEASMPIWRGRITHVPSHEWVLVKDLQGIMAFMQPYLGQHQDSPQQDYPLEDVLDHIQLDADMDLFKRDGKQSM